MIPGQSFVLAPPPGGLGGLNESWVFFVNFMYISIALINPSK